MTDIVIDEKHELVTVEAFERFADAPENADRRFELIYGEIVEKVPKDVFDVE